jgi:hypothetical protein
VATGGEKVTAANNDNVTVSKRYHDNFNSILKKEAVFSCEIVVPTY